MLSVAGNGYLTGGLGVGVENTTAGTLQTSGNAIIGGNVGIGTTSPYSRLEVWGPDTGFTTAFAVVNNSSTTAFAVSDNGNATYLGSIFQSSDQRLKTDITSLDASVISVSNRSTQSRLLLPHRPARAPERTSALSRSRCGSIFPATRLDDFRNRAHARRHPHPQLRRTYSRVSAIQALYADVTSIENIDRRLRQRSSTTQELCVGRTCNEIDARNFAPTGPRRMRTLGAIVGARRTSSGTEHGRLPQSPDTPPIIEINGDNPAIVQVGDTYNDLGATIAGPQHDLNLGITTYRQRRRNRPRQIDTSAAATDTIDYVATDQIGLTSTSTRTVFIEAPSIVPTDDASTTTPSSDSASTTEASSSAQ